jgi:hypothetical protein
MCYFELRKISESLSANLAADIAQHLRSRQHLGKTIVVCEKPLNLMSIVRKHWLKLARQLQRERSSTVNVEKILRLTNSIVHMHRMRFAANPPTQTPNAHVYFMTSAELDALPSNVYNFYTTVELPEAALTTLLAHLPDEALVVDYTGVLPSKRLHPKQQLYDQTQAAWQKVDAFLEKHGLIIKDLASPNAGRQERIDDALDILLSVSQKFLSVASNFQRTLELAQPVVLNATEQREYDILILLAHRVQALDPLTPKFRFTPSLNDEDTFFLHDVALENLSFAEAMQQEILRHEEAGRNRLAQAMAMLLFTLEQ